MKEYWVCGTIAAEVIVAIEAEDDENLTEEEMSKRAAEKLDEIGVLENRDFIGASGSIKFHNYSLATD